MGFYRNVPLKEKNANVREKMGYRESREFCSVQK